MMISAVQVLLTGLGEDGIPLVGRLSLSMYTGAGWIAALCGVVNLVLYHPKLFYESNIAAKEYAAKTRSGLDTGLIYESEFYVNSMYHLISTLDRFLSYI